MTCQSDSKTGGHSHRSSVRQDILSGSQQSIHSTQRAEVEAHILTHVVSIGRGYNESAWETLRTVRINPPSGNHPLPFFTECARSTYFETITQFRQVELRETEFTEKSRSEEKDSRELNHLNKRQHPDRLIGVLR